MSKQRKRKTVIHVNQHALRFNAKTGERKPVITVKSGKTNRYAMQAIFRDANGVEIGRVVYADGVNVKPLSCGARAWIQLTGEGSLELIDEGEPFDPTTCSVV